jgi:hypothetical protein
MAPLHHSLSSASANSKASTQYCVACQATFTSKPSKCPTPECGTSKPNNGWSSLLDEGSILNNRYQISERIYISDNGPVYLGVDLGSEKNNSVVIKTISNRTYAELVKQHNAINEIDHNNIIKSLDVVAGK